MRVGELSGELQAPNKCCNEYDLWADCDREGHSEGCFATYCDKCGTINYRDCEGENNG